jgi:hypothetical protein
MRTHDLTPRGLIEIYLERLLVARAIRNFVYKKVWTMRTRGLRNSWYDGYKSPKILHQHQVGF